MVSSKIELADGDIVEKETEHSKTACTEEFADLLQKNSLLMRAFLKFEKQELSGKKCKDGTIFEDKKLGLKITVIGHANWGEGKNNYRGYYLMVKMFDQTTGNQQKFFIKTMPGNDSLPLESKGCDEFIHSAEARRIIKDSEIQNVQVVDFAAGYQGREEEHILFQNGKVRAMCG